MPQRYLKAFFTPACSVACSPSNASYAASQGCIIIAPPLRQPLRAVALQSIRSIFTHRSGRQVKEKLRRLEEKKKAMEQAGLTFVPLKTPKGTRDYGPREMAIRHSVLGVVTEAFKRHGAETIDTPVFEMKDVLMGKYGEEGNKLVFDLVDQGGDLCSLRYDLTVPFARYLAMNKLEKMKRYQISKVYRRDNPVMTKGRYREFFQCDFDIAGEYDLMIPEAECLRIVDEILSELDLGEFETRINHRLLLEGMFALSGVPAKAFKTVCSSIDKLDKEPWAKVREELIGEKAIDYDSVMKLEGFVRLRELNPSLDNRGLLAHFKALDNAQVKKAAGELEMLLDYAESFGCSPARLVFEPSLARGLDYYTGAIYEVVMTGYSFNPSTPPSASHLGNAMSQVRLSGDGAGSGNNCVEESPTASVIGSVAAGGRYDKLVGMFSTHAGAKKSKDVPCAGISFGIERLFTIMEMKKSQDSSLRISPTDVYVVSAHKGLLKKRMELCAKLWSAGIRTETSYKANPKFLNQIQDCEANKIPLAVVIGESELAGGFVKLRDVPQRTDKEVKLDDLADSIRSALMKS